MAAYGEAWTPSTYSLQPNCDHPLSVGIFLGELRSCKTGKGAQDDLGQQYSAQDKMASNGPVPKAFQGGLACLADSSHLLTTLDLFLEGNCASFLIC